MKVIITKYATTSGIRVSEVELFSGPPYRKTCKDLRLLVYYHGDNFHFNKGTATVDVIKRFELKRASLEKALAKLDQKREAAIKAINEAQL